MIEYLIGLHSLALSVTDWIGASWISILYLSTGVWRLALLLQACVSVNIVSVAVAGALVISSVIGCTLYVCPSATDKDTRVFQGFPTSTTSLYVVLEKAGA